MRFKIILSIAFSILIITGLPGCDKKIPGPVDDDTVTIGTFNIKWLGDGLRDRFDRTDEDYELIARVIEDSGMEIVGLQEIENEEALYRIIKYLPDFSFYVGKKGRAQNLAVLYKKYIDLTYMGEYLPVAIETGRHRPGLIIQAKKGNFDWLMMVVHYKATSRYDDTPEKLALSYSTREMQAEKTTHWVDSVMLAGPEEDIIIVGDFNDNPEREKNPTLGELANHPNIFFLTSHLQSCKYEGWDVIDHIAVTGEAKMRYLNNSARVFDFYSSLPEQQADLVSDHCPVLAQFEIKSPDND